MPKTELSGLELLFAAAESVGWRETLELDLSAAWALLERWLNADDSRHVGLGVRHHPNEAACALWIEERLVAEGRATAADAGFESAMATAICRALVAAGGE